MHDVERIDPEEARRRLESEEGWAYLDVRTEEEFAVGHVPAAVNVPLLVRSPAARGLQPNPEFVERVKALFSAETKLIVGCQRGGRSLRACGILQAEGFRQVIDMRGGYDGELDPSGDVTFPGWARRGFPTAAE